MHLNPVRVGMVKKPADYPWSGHQAYPGEVSIPWIHTDWVLGQFAKRLATCRKRYAIFIKEGVKEGYRSDFHQGGEDDSRVLANDRFLEQVIGKIEPKLPRLTLDDIVSCVIKDYAIDNDELRGVSRNRQISEIRVIIGWLARQLKAATIKEVACYFQRDASTFSRHLGLADSKMKKSEKFKHMLDGYIDALTQA